ncbi:hypothetical protein EDE15_3544 [Edaphobacter aggregans]|uniref:Uncharacterized protein n=1 Tax=Edaphobacter aggregans TaxID=570835 RepID=A0A3R9QCK2_9BACT|nr:hypothetical protein [Edaphobacter aggregans]RSL17991.1 hypothetical protein EDE15_3544 [Edaphobacter aggregans]
MNTFQTGAPCMQKLDPQKRVNYTFGMVLGVDEFKQEQIYLMAKDHSQYRLAHGYGTVCGLQLQMSTAPDLEIQVSKGVAINPRGQEIHLQQQMCARLNDWLITNQTTLEGIFGNAPLSLSLCVVLCYRECPTDTVPVPGEPCRTQQDTMAASNIADSFQLKLCLNADQVISSPTLSPPIDTAVLNGLCFKPSQIEEDTIRRFGRLLHRVRIGDTPSSVSEAELEDLVRQLGSDSETITSPITSPSFDDSLIYLSTHDAPGFLRAAFLVWVTEVRPSLAAQPGECGCGCLDEKCVLLAELTFQVSKVWQVVGAVTVDESRRPYLLETRLLQEWLLNQVGGSVGGADAASSSVVAAGAFRLISPIEAVGMGPVLNGLTATPGPASNTFYLDWSGPSAYVDPTLGSPASFAYVVKGTAMGPIGATVGIQVLGFAPEGIEVAVKGANPTGFMVEISEITGG